MFLAEPLIYGLLETVKSPEVVAVLRPGSWSNLYVSRALVSTRLPRKSTRPNANSWYFNCWQRRSESRDAKLRVNDRRIAETRIARDGVFVSSVTRGHKVRVSRRTLSRRTDFPLFNTQLHLGGRSPTRAFAEIYGGNDDDDNNERLEEVERKASKRANIDPLERRFTVKGFTNRRQVFATSADRKLSRLPLFVQRRAVLFFLAARCPLLASVSPDPSMPRESLCYTRSDRRSHIDEIYVRGRPILRMRSH